MLIQSILEAIQKINKNATPVGFSQEIYNLLKKVDDTVWEVVEILEEWGLDNS